MRTDSWCEPSMTDYTDARLDPVCRLISFTVAKIAPAVHTSLTSTWTITATLQMWTLTYTATPTRKEGACVSEATTVGVVPHSCCYVRLCCCTNTAVVSVRYRQWGSYQLPAGLDLTAACVAAYSAMPARTTSMRPSTGRLRPWLTTPRSPLLLAPRAAHPSLTHVAHLGKRWRHHRLDIGGSYCCGAGRRRRAREAAGVIAMGPLEQRVVRTLRLRLCLRLRRRRLVGVVRRGASAAGTALRRTPRPLNDTDDVSDCMQVLLSA